MDQKPKNQTVSAAINIQNTNITTIWKLSKYINIREAELFAINQGLRYVQNNRLNDSVIFTDSPSALQLITNQTQKSPTNHIPHTTDNTHTDTPETKHKNTLNSIAKGIRGNEIIQQTSKKAHELTNPTAITKDINNITKEIKNKNRKI